MGIRILSKAQDGVPTVGDVDGMISDLDGMLDQFGFRVEKADVLTLDQTGHSTVFERASGIVRTSKPVRVRTPDGIDWRVVGGSDAVHVSLAEKLGATHIATCDRGLKGLPAGVIPAVLPDVY